jgi:hypothetical protein
MKSKKPVRTTYRVDLVISTGSYAPYTSRKGTDLGMAKSLAENLKRQSTGGRIVELPSGTVVEEWSFGTVQKSPNAVRDAIQALRDKGLSIEP